MSDKTPSSSFNSPMHWSPMLWPSNQPVEAARTSATTQAPMPAHNTQMPAISQRSLSTPTSVNQGTTTDASSSGIETDDLYALIMDGTNPEDIPDLWDLLDENAQAPITTQTTPTQNTPAVSEIIHRSATAPVMKPVISGSIKTPTPNALKMTDLEQVIQDNDGEKLKELFSLPEVKANPGIIFNHQIRQGPFKNYILAWAVRHHKDEIVKILIEKGASIQITYNVKMKPFPLVEALFIEHTASKESIEKICSILESLIFATEKEADRTGKNKEEARNKILAQIENSVSAKLLSGCHRSSTPLRIAVLQLIKAKGFLVSEKTFDKPFQSTMYNPPITPVITEPAKRITADIPSLANLEQIIRSNDSEKLKELFNLPAVKANPAIIFNHQFQQGNSKNCTLAWAVRYHKEKIVEVLIDEGANIQTPYNAGGRSNSLIEALFMEKTIEEEDIKKVCAILESFIFAAEEDAAGAGKNKEEARNKILAQIKSAVLERRNDGQSKNSAPFKMAVLQLIKAKGFPISEEGLDNHSRQTNYSIQKKQTQEKNADARLKPKPSRLRIAADQQQETSKRQVNVFISMIISSREHAKNYLTQISEPHLRAPFLTQLNASKSSRKCILETIFKNGWSDLLELLLPGMDVQTPLNAAYQYPLLTLVQTGSTPSTAALLDLLLSHGANPQQLCGDANFITFHALSRSSADRDLICQHLLNKMNYDPSNNGAWMSLLNKAKSVQSELVGLIEEKMNLHPAPSNEFGIPYLWQTPQAPTIIETPTPAYTEASPILQTPEASLPRRGIEIRTPEMSFDQPWSKRRKTGE